MKPNWVISKASLKLKRGQGDIDVKRGRAIKAYETANAKVMTKKSFGVLKEFKENEEMLLGLKT